MSEENFKDLLQEMEQHEFQQITIEAAIVSMVTSTKN